MASINTIVKRKQYLWLGIVVVGTASAIGGALYLSDVDMSGNGETVAEQEPVPDMTGVVDTTFDDKVRQHATTEMQVTAAQMQKQYEEIRRELDVLNKQRGDDQRRIEKLGQDNAALAEQVKALGANPVTATGEPVPQMPASPPGPEGEPQPGNTPVSFPPQGSVAVPPPTAFYPGNGVTPPPQVTYQSVPVPNRIQRKVFIRSVLDSGGFAVVFDMGDGYKSLCENMGGVYLDGETLRFNPFANITDIDQSAERVRDQLSVMASPNGNLDEVHEGLLLQAVRASWLAKKNKARIDDVVDFLKNARDNDQYVESPTIRSRLDEMIVLLDQYTANGTYGQYFNSDEPSLRDDAKMVVLELGGLEDRPSLLVAVMFSLIIYIENRMYRTPRNLKKLNVIDEGWRLLDFKNHKVGEFIEKGYRTARRHTGAYITITQNIVDFDSDKASSAARAAWGNSSYKIILKQSAKEFAKYNQLYPDQFLPLQRDMIGKFGAAKDQWFSSFLLQVENHSSWHRLFVDPLSRAMYSSDGPDFEFVQQKRKEGLSIHEAVWQLAWKKSGPEMASLEAWLEEHEKYRSVA
ncbi:TPA: hypothetical protein HIF14_002190 [Escherichia coli]|nr:hypothetical protein [Escherichia coli]